MKCSTPATKVSPLLEILVFNKIIVSLLTLDTDSEGKFIVGILVTNLEYPSVLPSSYF